MRRGGDRLRFRGLGREKLRTVHAHISEQVAAIVSRFTEIGRARLVVDNPDGSDRMTLHVEMAGEGGAIVAAIQTAIRDVTKLRGEVAMRRPGELANDGKVIDDTRKFD
jgi:phenylacetate-CoA ligase